MKRARMKILKYIILIIKLLFSFSIMILFVDGYSEYRGAVNLNENFEMVYSSWRGSLPDPIPEKDIKAYLKRGIDINENRQENTFNVSLLVCLIYVFLVILELLWFFKSIRGSSNHLVRV